MTADELAASLKLLGFKVAEANEIEGIDYYFSEPDELNSTIYGYISEDVVQQADIDIDHYEDKSTDNQEFYNKLIKQLTKG